MQHRIWRVENESRRELQQIQRQLQQQRHPPLLPHSNQQLPPPLRLLPLLHRLHAARRCLPVQLLSLRPTNGLLCPSQPHGGACLHCRPPR